MWHELIDQLALRFQGVGDAPGFLFFLCRVFMLHVAHRAGVTLMTFHQLPHSRRYCCDKKTHPVELQSKSLLQHLTVEALTRDATQRTSLSTPNNVSTVNTTKKLCSGQCGLSYDDCTVLLFYFIFYLCTVSVHLSSCCPLVCLLCILLKCLITPSKGTTDGNFDACTLTLLKNK